MADHPPGHDGLAADRRLHGLGHRPGDLRHVGGHAAVDLALEVLDDLRTPLLPPRLGGRDLAAVLQGQGVRPVRIGVGLGGIVVGRVRLAGGALPFGPGRSFVMPELPHHVGVVLARELIQARALLGAEQERVRRARPEPPAPVAAAPGPSSHVAGSRPRPERAQIRRRWCIGFLRAGASSSGRQARGALDDSRGLENSRVKTASQASPRLRESPIIRTHENLHRPEPPAPRRGRGRSRGRSRSLASAPAAPGHGDPTDGRREAVPHEGRRAGQLHGDERGVSAAVLEQVRRSQHEHGPRARLLGPGGAPGRPLRLLPAGQRDRPGPRPRHAARPVVVRELEEQHVVLRPGLGEARSQALPPRDGQGRRPPGDPLALLEDQPRHGRARVRSPAEAPARGRRDAPHGGDGAGRERDRDDSDRARSQPGGR